MFVKCCKHCSSCFSTRNFGDNDCVNNSSGDTLSWKFKIARVHQLFPIQSLESRRGWGIRCCAARPLADTAGVTSRIIYRRNKFHKCVFILFFKIKNAKNLVPFLVFSSFKLFLFPPQTDIYICFNARCYEGAASWVCVIFSFYAVMLTLYGGSNITTEEEPWTQAIPTRERLLLSNRAINRHRPTLPAIYTAFEVFSFCKKENFAERFILFMARTLPTVYYYFFFC